jgi:hypothetical protein
MSPVNIDWRAIHPLNGSRDKGFEELCAQLARVESPTGSRFERKGGPDAGVECYAVLGDGTEWGWQAKYFDGLGDSQWSQIDDSIKTAIRKHPRLVKYFVCVPYNRPDARVGGQKSAKEKWDEHVEKWTKWCSDEGISIEFLYLGSHELLEQLSRPRFVGLVRFWFDSQGFDGAWFSARLHEALESAGPRYTPEIHVDLPIAREFEAFGRTDWFFDQLKAHAKEIRRGLRSAKYSQSVLDKPEIVKAIAALPLEIRGILDKQEIEIAALVPKVQAVITSLGAIKVLPVGSLPFSLITDQVDAAQAAVDEAVRLISNHERVFEAESDTTSGKKAGIPSYISSGFRERRLGLLGLSSELWKAHDALVHAEKMAGANLVLLRGNAGTGKTHLLCDVARERIAAGRPTVLLMGQRFVSNDEPWKQALQQLDLANLSAGEFVGALESAAEAADSRALVIIDAINEGCGRTIWPSNLPAFLAHVQRSPWIGVVLSVRSSYEEIIVPEGVRKRAEVLTHDGFVEYEYDATKTFFEHYGLELPSTPLLASEFRNPLFLKTLCSGLRARGERRLPRGYQGITAVFELYLSAINQNLALALGFNPKDPLIWRTLEAFSGALVDSRERWLTLTKASEVVNAQLPGRDFERSLYRGLVVEGILIEEAAWPRRAGNQEVVYIAYERLADHLIARTLLDMNLNESDPASAFNEGGPLAFLYDTDTYVPPGLIEAMCIQLPELIGQELVDLAPKITDYLGIGAAFRQSLIWRTPSAFSERTRKVLNELIRNEDDQYDTLDVLVTVATLPGHPLNATYLDRRLRRDAMPDRDAWWSVFLHRGWRSHGAVDRLVDWSSSVTPTMAMDDETVDLCATALSWMFTTSNRFLRDRATKALVSLLTSRLGAAVRLVERFNDVDDPYVIERVYAVAYGIAMRCNDSTEVGNLASCVYAHVFAAGTPPPHILLRDYARGVIERSLYLGSDIEMATERIRPPYGSQFPAIPTEDDIQLFLPDRSRGSHDSGDLEWAQNRIGGSVMSDDFAQYVIGTNSSSSSRSWLSLKLDEPKWVSPELRLRALIAELSHDESRAWAIYETAKNAYEVASHSLFDAWFINLREETPSREGAPPDLSSVAREFKKTKTPEIEELESKKNQVLIQLRTILTGEHAERLNEILIAKDGGHEMNNPPGFDLGQIQRYILRRVFELGWTTERFGYFDRFVIGYRGREASKPERIGKKYQWIAYHEIMAFIADHYQYRERFGGEGGSQAYEGPWQVSLRDIDPSCTIRDSRGSLSLEDRTPAWWDTARYENWGDPDKKREWVEHSGDLPKVENLLTVTNPGDGSRWINAQSYFDWNKQPPVDQDSSDVERRELWFISNAYLVREKEAQAFMEWAETVDFFGRWMPETPSVYQMFLGEHGWAPSSAYFQREYSGNNGWIQPERGCPVETRLIVLNYQWEGGGLDCSVDKSYELRLPASEFVTGLGIRWNGNAGDFVDSTGRLAATDPSAYHEGPSSLLLREDLIREYLGKEKLAACWTVVGEKSILGAVLRPEPDFMALRLSGAYLLGDSGPVGFLKYMLDNRDDEGGGGLTTLGTIRTPA